MAETKLTTVGTTTPALSKGQKFKVELMNELDKSLEDMGTQFTPYGKKCVINAIGSLVIWCQSNSVKLEEINPIVLKSQLENVGLTELNMAGLPSEAYFDMRKVYVDVQTKDGKTEKRMVYNVVIKPQGAGNEKLVRKYGVGIAPNGLRNSWLVREGDEFIMPEYEGTTITPPVWKPNVANMNKKVVLVVYPLIKEDGTEEFLMATRDSIIPNIVAQIRQNALYKFTTEEVNQKTGRTYNKVDKEARDEFYKQLNRDCEKLGLEELLDKYEDYVNPTYTSGGSREAMILRKMKNNALKNYPKEYDDAHIKNAVENMFEEKDETLNEKPKVFRDTIDVVEKVEAEIEEKPTDKNAPVDFDVNGEIVEDKNNVDLSNLADDEPF